MTPPAATPAQGTSLVSYLRAIPRATAAPARAAVVAGENPPKATPESQSRAKVDNDTNARDLPAISPSVASKAVPASIGRGLFVANGCAACHGPNGENPLCPNTHRNRSEVSDNPLAGLLRHPSNKMRDGGMPAINLPDASLQQLAAYLSSLGGLRPH